MSFHHAERVVSARTHERVDDRAARILHIGMNHQVANARDVRLVAVLLEKKPLKDLRALKAIGKHEGRAFREVRNDRVRLEQKFAVVKLHGRNPAIRKFAEKIRRARLAFDDVEFDPLKRNRKLGQQQANLVAVARWQIVVKANHRRGDQSSGLDGRNVSPIRYASTARAASRPSQIAHTTSDCPRRESPAAKTPGTLDM